MSLIDDAVTRDGVRWLRVAPEQWRQAHSEAFHAGHVRCEWLTAVDSGSLDVVSHVVGDEGLLVIHATLTNDSCPSIDDIYASAAFHQREVSQMFGITFESASDTRPAFEADFGGHPLRRTFALRPRIDHAWPGADDASARRPTPVPGVQPEWQL